MAKLTEIKKCNCVIPDGQPGNKCHTCQGKISTITLKSGPAKKRKFKIKT